MRYWIVCIVAAAVCALTCQRQAVKQNTAQTQQTTVDVRGAFSGPAQGIAPYWYQGKAELNRYTLEQQRYGEKRDGEVILLFVTEDFLTDNQVKNDSRRTDHSTTVLKSNKIRRFITGIYDYSVMTSVFTPVEVAQHPMTSKVTISSQDWCGQSFAQINQQGVGYRYRLFSYFESEGDQDHLLDYAPLEDELFNRIRIHPEGLPTGHMKVYPSTTYLRFSHRPFEATEAIISRHAYTGEDFDGQDLMVYQVNYPSYDRTLDIIYEAAAPYKIAGWTDAYPDGTNGALLKTTARRSHQLYRAYWEDNQQSDLSLREALGLQ